MTLRVQRLTRRKDSKGRRSRKSWESLTRAVLTVKRLIVKKGVLLRMRLLLLSKKWTQRMSLEPSRMLIQALRSGKIDREC